MGSPYQTPPRDRIVAGIGTGIVLGALGYALLAGLVVQRGLPRAEETPTLTIDALPPPPKAQIVPQPKSHTKAGAASPRNLRNTASDVVAPKPRFLPPLPQQLHAAPIAGLGLAPLAGASNLPGPGTGAGGQGNGTGSGGAGNGNGGGDTPPEQIRGHLDYSAVPGALREQGAQGSVGVRYFVNTDGRASGCSVTASSGTPQLDAVTCSEIEKRFRFEPSRDTNGRPVRSQIVETHTWIMDRREQQER